MTVFDHARIRDEQDRSFTTALVDALETLDPASDAWSDAVVSLRHLEDYRSIEPMRRFVHDRRRPVTARKDVAEALAGFDLTSTSAERITWWQSGDEAIQCLAMRLMERSEAPIVLATAVDAVHPLQAVAVATLEWGFEAPEFQEAKEAALRSARPDVREAAAYTVSWDEPLTAEPKLQELLSDEHPDVARAAAYALQYFPSLSTLEHLRRHRGMASADAERQLAESIDYLEWSIEDELARCDPEQRRALQAWVDAIGFQPQPSNSEEHARESTAPAATRDLGTPFDQRGFEDALDTTTGSFRSKSQVLHAIQWDAVPTDQRPPLADRMARHPDPEIRIIATRPLATWNEGDRLAALMDDPHAVVRKCAMYGLGEVAPDRRFAGLAQQRLANRAGTAATEALATFAHHSPPAERVAVLLDRATTSDQFDVRAAAVRLLAATGAKDQLAQVLPVLDHPPFTTWDVHIALLETEAARAANPARLAELVDVDNIHVAAAAARLTVR